MEEIYLDNAATTFPKPECVYQAMDEIARTGAVNAPSDQLFIKGEAFAIRAGGRSPRVARQFIELLSAGVRL